MIAKTKDEASAVASEMLSGKMLGEAGARVVLEEFLQGDELSFLVVSDGERVAPLVAAQDHKRVGDGDTGPNTGGMGAYTTPTIIDDQMRPLFAYLRAFTVHARFTNLYDIGETNYLNRPFPRALTGQIASSVSPANT